MDCDLDGLTGRIVIPADPFYNEARQGYNRAVQQYPLIINYCRDKWDVANAVIWSRKYYVPLRIRSGGHNYEGYSNGNCTLIIDVSDMTDIDLDERKNLLYVQGGVTNRLVYEFVSSMGYPFPGGTCPTVGVSGYSTGGGWGLSCRNLGLGCDSLEEIELVNYEGSMVKANRSCNEDLFWACRGAGGGNFGVIVSMTFRLPPKVDQVTLIEIDYLHVTQKEQKKFLGIWQRWLKHADPRITLISRIYNSVNDGLAMLARGIFYGKPDEAEQIVKPFLELAGADYSLEYVTFLQAVTIIGNTYPPFERFQSASRFVLQDFSESEISELVGLIRRRSEGSVFAGLSLYALGGRVREVEVDDTAFFYRKAHFILWLETVWEENRFAEKNKKWISDRFPALASVTTGSYVNFPYNRLPNYLEEYYGLHVRKLEWIKEEYDPYNIFSFPQGILGELPLPEPAFRENYRDEPPVKLPDDEVYRGFRYVKHHIDEKHFIQPSIGDSSPQVWNFVSAPDLHPMKVSVNVKEPGTSRGLIFVAPYTAFGEEMIGQTGSLIMDETGDPVWFGPLTNRYLQNTDFRAQIYHNNPVLTMWQGTISGTQSANPNLPDGDPKPGAYFQILDQHYKVLKKLEAQKGFTADVHEFLITKRNTALFTAVKQVPADLSRYGGPVNGYFDDYSIQEVDLETGALLFFWDALAHVNPRDSMLPASSARDSNNIWDCFHMNSVQEGPRHTLLVSMRNTWAIYSIAKNTGDILWQLGGKRGDFSFGPNAAFSWQHDARHRGENHISLFDDACCASQSSPPQGQARGLILRLDFKKMTANIDRTYYHDPALFVASQGNVQELPNGNQFVGWGQQPYLSEFAGEGNTAKDPSLNFLYDIRFPNQNISYRSFKNKWVGLPLNPPSIAVKSIRHRTVVFASWNGSTEAAAWQVLAGQARDALVIKATAARTGFETKIPIHATGPFYQVEALNVDGRVIGTSQIIYHEDD